ncbi:histidine kinase [Hymenobacter sp. BT635]|uniref:histidine kinase n=1 Tax=Hymenobacter nitidus TaxID=2880929 RepID=A0ABS8AG93_9BACT|nr:histidine kinase [Hymenobacter nitidus]MCB2379465.1 histidine kinase [Hymenobacter nitidus]
MENGDNIYLLIMLSMVATFGIIVSFVLLHFRNLNRLSVQAEALQQAQIQYQQKLLEAVIESQEAERRRIGQDLHDDVGTALSNLRMTVELYQQRDGFAADPTAFISTCKTIIDKVMGEVRQISHNLSPVSLNLYGFTEAVEELADMLNNGGRLRCSLDNEAAALLDALPAPQATALYRVVEELLNNAIKHSGGQHVALKFYFEPNALVFSCHDDGQGMRWEPASKKGMGLHNIESRLTILQATYTVHTAPGAGFGFVARLPL